MSGALDPASLKRKLLPFLVVVASWGWGSAIAGQAAGTDAVTVQAPSSCELAARCEVTARVVCPGDAKCSLEPPGRLGAFEVLQVAEAPEAASHEWRLTLVAFEPGPQPVPPVAARIVSARDGSVTRALSAEATIEVRGPGVTPDERLRDAAGPIDPGLDWRVVAAWVVAAAIGLGALELVRRVRRHPRAPTQPAPRAITIEGVIDALRALERHSASSGEDVLAIYRRISDELRVFLRARLGVPAEAFSSREIAREISATRTGPTHGPRGRDLLEHVDRVKFGGVRPDREARREAIGRAIDLVRALGPPRSTGLPERHDVA